MALIDAVRRLRSQVRPAQPRRARRADVRTDRTVLFRLSRFCRRRRSAARGLRIWPRASSRPLFCQPAAGPDDRRASGDIADHQAKPQPRVAGTRRQELRRDPSRGAGSPAPAALRDAGRRAPGAEAGRGSDAAVRPGARAIGRLGPAVGARLPRGDDRSAEGVERRRRPDRAGEAGGSARSEHGAGSASRTTPPTFSWSTTTGGCARSCRPISSSTAIASRLRQPPPRRALSSTGSPSTSSCSTS